MSFTFSNNITANRANYALKNHLSNYQSSLQNLSTGMKVNNAEDDPSGYAIREIYRSDVRVMQKGLNNASRGISAIQTAETAIGDIHELLVRMKELATQSSTGTYTESQRIIINSEFSQMATEIDRIASTIQFANVNMLDGTLSGSNRSRMNGSWIQNLDTLENEDKQGMKLHFGTQNRVDDYYFIKIGDLTTNGMFGDGNLAADGLSILGQHDAQLAISKIDSAIHIKEVDRANLGHLQNRLQITMNHMETQKRILQDADSIISDADYAEEIAEMTKHQVLAQATTSILTQANALPQMALSLLS